MTKSKVGAEPKKQRIRHAITKSEGIHEGIHRDEYGYYDSSYHCYCFAYGYFFHRGSSLAEQLTPEYIKEHLICEHFITLMNKDKDQRNKYAKQVYDMVAKAYEYIGGLAGCKSFKDFKDQYVDDLRNKNLMWKLVRRNGDTITACKIYAINDLGRKSVVMASLDTEQGKNDLNKILRPVPLKLNSIYAKFLNLSINI